MKKYKGFLFIASLALVVVLLAGCSSSNPIAEELATQRAALIIGSFDDIHTITVNGTEIKPDEDGDWKGLFEVGSDVRIVVDPADGWEFDGWDFNNNANGLETTIVMFDDNTRITPNFSNGETGDVGAEGLQMVMETQPGNSIVGEYIEGPPAVVITNNQGPVEGVEVEVSLDTETMLNGTTVQTTDADGIATFDDLVINTVASGYELVFNAEFVGIPLMVISEPFDVNEPAPVEDLVASIEIEPADDQEIKAGDILEFTATAYDEDGNPIEDIVNFSWQNADENGVFNNTTAGEYDVRASIGEVSSPVTKVTVKHAEVVEDGDHVVTIDPAGEIKVQAGQDQVFTARAEDKYGNLITEDVNDFVWNGAENGVFNETTLGDYKVSAVYAGVESAKTDVEVIAELEGIDYIELKPDEDQTVQAGEEIQLTATAYDQFDNVITSDASIFTWKNADNGLFNKTAADNYEVKASLNGIESNTVYVTVTAIPAETGGDFTITIDPAPDATIEAGINLNFTAEARDKYNNLITDNVEDFGWSGAIAGVFNETVVGDYQVYATLEGEQSDSTAVTVTAHSPDNPDIIEISPAPDAEVDAGEDLKFSAKALDQYGNIITDDVSEFDWTGADDNGLFNEKVADVYDVYAEYRGVISATTEVTVRPLMDAVARVEIMPDEDKEIIAGETVQFEAKAFDEYDNIITGNVADFIWTEANSSGLFENTTAGEYTVTAMYDGVLSDEVVITVKARPADPEIRDHTVTISPAPTANVPVGEDLEFSAKAEDRYGNLITDDVNEFTWYGADNNGIFNESSVGSYDVSAEYVKVESDVTVVTVQVVENGIASIEIDPSEDQTIKAGETIQFTATAFDEFGNPLNDITDFSWENADENGLFDKTTAGEYEVKAYIGEVSSLATKVTVEHAEVIENGDHKVTIEPAGSISVQVGVDQIFTAEVKDEFGNLITDNVNDLTWFNAENGVFNKDTVGQYNVTAEYAGVISEPTVVTVWANPPYIEDIKTVIDGTGVARWIGQDYNNNRYIEIALTDSEKEFNISFRYNSGFQAQVISVSFHENDFDDSHILIEYGKNTKLADVADELVDFFKVTDGLSEDDLEITFSDGSRAGSLKTVFPEDDGEDYDIFIGNQIMLDIYWNENLSELDIDKFLLSFVGANTGRISPDSPNITTVTWNSEDIELLAEVTELAVDGGAVTSEATGETNLDETWKFDGNSWTKK